MSKLFIYCNYSILFNDLLYWQPLPSRCRPNLTTTHEDDLEKLGCILQSGAWSFQPLFITVVANSVNPLYPR